MASARGQDRVRAAVTGVVDSIANWREEHGRATFAERLSLRLRPSVRSPANRRSWRWSDGPAPTSWPLPRRESPKCCTDSVGRRLGTSALRLGGRQSSVDSVECEGDRLE